MSPTQCFLCGLVLKLPFWTEQQQKAEEERRKERRWRRRSRPTFGLNPQPPAARPVPPGPETRPGWAAQRCQLPPAELRRSFGAPKALRQKFAQPGLRRFRRRTCGRGQLSESAEIAASPVPGAAPTRNPRRSAGKGPELQLSAAGGAAAGAALPQPPSRVQPGLLALLPATICTGHASSLGSTFSSLSPALGGMEL